MMRLTIRSGRDGRFLARLIEQNGFAYVLDIGDGRIIEDATQRLSKGFTMWRFGRLVTAAPTDADLFQLLAEFYAGEGLLVFLDEPTWAERGEITQPPSTAQPLHVMDEVTIADEVDDLDPVTEWVELPTEIAPRPDRPAIVVDPALEALMDAPPLPVSEALDLPDLGFEDTCTQELPRLDLDLDLDL